MVEVNVGFHHGVIQQEPPYLGNSETTVVVKYRSGRERRFQKDLGPVH